MFFLLGIPLLIKFTSIMIPSQKRIIVSHDFTFFQNTPYHQKPSLIKENLREENSFGQYLDLTLNLHESTTSNTTLKTNNKPKPHPTSEPNTTSVPFLHLQKEI